MITPIIINNNKYIACDSNNMHLHLDQRKQGKRDKPRYGNIQTRPLSPQKTCM